MDRTDANPQVSSSNVSSATSSPLPSREPSPTRSLRQSIAAARNPAGPGTRSRKNSQNDSRAATRNNGVTVQLQQKNLFGATAPTLMPTSTEANPRSSLPQKSSPTALVLEPQRDSPRWPVSPRLRSPPPILNKPPVVNFQRSTPPLPSDQSYSDVEADEGHLQPGMRTPARAANTSTSTLETVQEVSPLASPSLEAIGAALENLQESLAAEGSSQVDPTEYPASQASKAESGSEYGTVRRANVTSAPPQLISRQSSTSNLARSAKNKPSEGTVKTMTVETETVTSIPSVALAPSGIQGANGSLRTKPSSETIRPKKEKKKSARKQQAVQNSAASSKADNFEAKIASAVDEADTSDSEETFVYDSNPPDARDRPHSNRFHSRTPSAASMVSQLAADRNGMRSIHSVMDGHAPAASLALKKKKFSNSYSTSSNNAGSGPAADGSPMLHATEDDGHTRGGSSNQGSARGTAHRQPHHHFGVWGRNAGGNGHTYLFDNESPFSSGPKTRLSGSSGVVGSVRPSPGPPSPRFTNLSSPRNAAGSGKKNQGYGAMGMYDLDDTTTTGADDERASLLPSSVRSNRSRRGPRSYHHHSLGGGHHLPHVPYRQHLHGHPPSLLNRMASCLVLAVMLLLVVSGAIGFMFATSQPLTNVELVKIANVIASEQELMFDMTLKAQNPNVVVVVVDSSDLEIFAKSPHAGTDADWRPAGTKSNPSRPRSSRRKGRGRGASGTLPSSLAPVDSLDEPSDDQPADDTAPNMRLGTIFDLDQPFSFEGSFFNKGASISTGGLRLQRPGNGTEGGTERWERILEDEFDLILKGVLKYTLPLSQRVRTIAIAGRTKVKPNSANDPGTGPKKPD
ncbi:hypothetical protein MCOR02_006552 [Pyricularia oryzae]|uniref:Phospholipid metabolism enzyme regulator n=1 Tax=Pyricularia grisea TaxID=148305 RepID=A0ABQ8N4H4_PYRGI|nr:hypothetical protein MCOR02_006552 [Pyricularia oryzae]KAI6291125.1 hypothetical protein MCOR33_010829 [Pyricularia grisea]KAI6447323.1 hypothetical protein MCOR22_003407 [Pyricularia oryzae]KAI6453613.1 hypothetical protein MCOR17_009208 [Pyricularia oryzae]KAI6592634.1 hypothetical protein MCOR06_004114 [Pyricularia oryzae]